MSLWKRLFGLGFSAKPQSKPKSVDDEMPKWNEVVRALLASEANWQFVRDALHRLEAAGLHIDPALNRELIVVRALRDAANYCKSGDIISFFTEKQDMAAKNSPDLLLLLDLISETDAFHDFEDFDFLDVAFPNRVDLDTRQIQTVLETHSNSVFLNAASISILNIDIPSTLIEELVRELEVLAQGDFMVRSVVATTGSDKLGAQIILDDGRACTVEIDNWKRADIVPLLTALNAIIAPLRKGTFTFLLSGDSEILVVVYILLNKQIPFSQWAEQQYFSDGTSPTEYYI